MDSSLCRAAVWCSCALIWLHPSPHACPAQVLGWSSSKGFARRRVLLVQLSCPYSCGPESTLSGQEPACLAQSNLWSCSQCWKIHVKDNFIRLIKTHAHKFLPMTQEWLNKIWISISPFSPYCTSSFPAANHYAYRLFSRFHAIMFEYQISLKKRTNFLLVLRNTIE